MTSRPPRAAEIQALEKRVYLTTETHHHHASLLTAENQGAYVVNLSAAAQHAAKRVHARRSLHAKGKLQGKPKHPHKKVAVSGKGSATTSGNASKIKVVKKTHHRGTSPTALAAAASQSAPIGSVVNTLNPPVADAVYSMALQQDGKIVVLGEHDGTFSVLRYLVDGTLDPSFGVNGQSTVSFDPGKDASHALAIDYAGAAATNPDYGKIVVAGESTSGFVIARLKTDGTPDQTFGSGGKVQSVLAGRADSLVLQPSGRILVGGQDVNGQPVVIRLLASGQQDLSLGTNGVFHGPILDLTGVAVSQSGGITPGVHRKGQIILHPFGCGSGCGSCSSYSAPSVGFISNPYSGTESVNFTGSGCVSDPNPSASFSAWVQYGDSTGCQSLTVNSGGGYTLSHTYSSDQTYTITVGVTDTNDNEFGSNNTTITTVEPTPTASFSGATVAEAQTYSASGTISSADTSPNYTAAVNYGDGSGTQPLTVSGSSFTLSHAYHEEGTYSVVVTSTNADPSDTPSSSSTTHTVIVNEFDPQLTISGSYHAQVGSTYTLSLSQADASDTLGGWQIDWGDGSAAQSVTAGTTTVTHIFPDAAASNVITATATDEGTTYSSNALPIAVEYGTLTDPPATNFSVMFQPWDYFTDGYTEDFGLVFGNHSDIYESTVNRDYGWTADARAASVRRSGNDGVGYDSFIQLPSPNTNNTQNQWEVGLANGTYQVTITSGDPTVTSGATYSTYVNGTQVTNHAASSGSGRWTTASASVTVSNGWLKVYSGPSAMNNVINTISIVPTVHLTSAPSTAPTAVTAYAESTQAINLNWADTTDNESGFKIERSTTSGGTYTLIATTIANADSYVDTGLSASTSYYYRIVPTNSVGDCSTYGTASAVTLNSNAEAPYKGTPWAVSSTATTTIQAEDFDTGGQNVGYHTAAATNAGGRYRQTGAGIAAAGPTELGYYLGWNQGGNWYNYTVNVASAGTYRLDFRVASEGVGGSFAMSLDGTGIVNSVPIPDTGGWNAFETVSVDNVYLPAGQHVLRLSDVSTGNLAEGNYDWFAFTPEATVPAPPEQLFATAVSDTTVNLNWNDQTTIATGYKVLRSTIGGTFSQVGSTLSAFASTYTDTSASANTTYLYEIQAVNAQTPPTPPLVSNQATVRTPSATAAAASATADAYVSSDVTSNNYGDPSSLLTKSSDDRIFLTFNLSAFSSVNRVVLRLFGSVPTDQTGVSVNAYGLTAAPTWTESALTWSNQPAVNSTPLATESVSGGSARWYEWDITSYVQSQFTAGNHTIGLQVRADSPTLQALSFNSRSSSVNAPLLLVSTTSAVVPSGPAGLQLTSVGSTTVGLSWTDNPPTPTNMYAQWSTDDTTWSTSSALSATATSDTISGLTANTFYYFRVYGAIGSTDAYSNVVFGTTAPAYSSYSISGEAYENHLVPLAQTSSGYVNLQNLVGSKTVAGDEFRQAGAVGYFAQDNSTIVAEQGPTGENLYEVSHYGAISLYATIPGLADGGESTMAIAQPGNLGGFTPGDIFFGFTSSGSLVQVLASSPGSPVPDWAVLAGDIGDGIADVSFDTSGSFGGDLIVLTSGGAIWLVDKYGNCGQLAALPSPAAANKNYESAIALPNDPRYGPFAGNLLVAIDDGTGTAYMVDHHGNYQIYSAPPNIEEVRLIPPDQNFFGITDDFQLLGAPATDLSSYVGDIMGVEESNESPVVMTWDGSGLLGGGLAVSPSSTVSAPGYERMGFAPSGIVDPLDSLPQTQTPLSGVTLTLTNSSGTTLGTSVTDANGDYAFNGLTASTSYYISEATPSGYTEVTPGSNPATIAVSTGSDVKQDFVYKPNGTFFTAPTPVFTTSPSTSATGVPLSSPATPPGIQPAVAVTYNFEATDSDPNGLLSASLVLNSPPTPAWITLSDVTGTSGYVTGTITVDPPINAVGTYNPGLLEVTDTDGGVSDQPFTVYVKAPPQPAPPTNLHVIATGENSVLVTWTPPVGVSIGSYHVWYGRANDPSNPSYSDLTAVNTVASSAATSYTVTGLTANTPYVFAVSDIDSATYESDYSNAEETQTWVNATGLWVQGVPVSVSEGVSYSGVVADFIDEGGPTTASSYTATINWGDGTTVAGTLANDTVVSGWFDISPASGHAYVENGQFPIVVTVTGPLSTSANDQSQSYGASVSDTALYVTASTLPVFTEGTAYSGITVGTFTDADDSSPQVGNYLAQIDWGDGDLEKGTITETGSGSTATFTVTGNHLYSTITPGQVILTVQHNDSALVASQMSYAPTIVPEPAPATPAAPGAFAVSSSQIEIEWPEDSTLDYALYRKSSTNSSPVRIPPADSDDGDVIGNDPYWDQQLTQGTTYYYALQAIDGQNISSGISYYSTGTVTWGNPLSPTGVTASVSAGNLVELSWSQPTITAGTGAEVSQWDILRSTDATHYTSILDAGNIVPSSPYYDQTVIPNSTYYYEVVAVDDDGDKSAPAISNVATTDMASITNTPPAPTSLAANSAGGYDQFGSGGTTYSTYRVDLSWTEASTADTLLGFDIYRATKPDYSDASLIGSSAHDRLYYFDDVIAPSTSPPSYYYQVEAVVEDQFGDELASYPANTSVALGTVATPYDVTYQPSVSLETSNTDPTAPGGVDTGAVLITWAEPVPDNQAQWEVFRGEITSGTTYWNTTTLGVSPDGGNSWVDSQALPGTSYVYMVIPVNTVLANPTVPSTYTSSEVIVTPQSSTVAPYNLAATVGWNSNNTWDAGLTWTPAPDAGNVHYFIYRRTSSTPYVQLNENVSGTSFIDDNGGQGLDPAATYFYTVRAVAIDNGGVSNPSNEVPVVMSQFVSPKAAVLEITSPSTSSVLSTSGAGDVGSDLGGTASQINNGLNISIDTPIRGVIEQQAVGYSLNWALTLHPTSASTSQNDIQIASGTTSYGSIENGDAYLGDLDPTRYPSGSYQLILSATEIQGSTTLTSTSSDLSITLESNFKLGNLTLPATDASFNVPGGTPIMIARDYDSQQVNTYSPDFGYGWRMDLWDTNLHTTASAVKSYDNPYAGLEFGDLVYITLPGGEQHAFAFEPQSIDTPSQYQNLVGSLETFIPQFIAVDGSGATLVPPSQSSTYLTFDVGSNTYRDIYQNEYNPAVSPFSGSYTLTTLDNRVYTINSASGLIATFTDAQGNVTTYPTTSIGGGTSYIQYTPEGGSIEDVVTIIRDSSSGLITSAFATGATTAVNYAYDSQGTSGNFGNLIGVTDRAGNVTTYQPDGELAYIGVFTDHRWVYPAIERNSDGAYWTGTTFTTLVTTAAAAEQAYGNSIGNLTPYYNSFTGVTSYWNYSDFPTGITTGPVTVSLFESQANNHSAAPGDTLLGSIQMDLPQTPSTGTLHNSYLTGVIGPNEVTMLQAAYSPTSFKLTSLVDAYNNSSNVKTGGFNGTSDGQSTSDLAPSSGAPNNEGNAQTIYDSHGNVARTIKQLNSPGTTNAYSYLVTVHDYAYAVGDVNDEVQSDDPTGSSNNNALFQQTDWQPFTVLASNTTGAQFTQEPDSDSPHTITTYGLMNDPLHLLSDPGRFKPSEVDNVLGDETVLSTKYLYGTTYTTRWLDIETTTDPYGNVTTDTYAYDYDTNTQGLLLQSTNPAGETTYYAYNTASQATASYVIRGGATYYLSQEAYSTSTNASSGPTYGYTTVDGDGGIAGMESSSTDSAGLVTYETYTPDGMPAATYHEWIDPANSSNKEWVYTENLYDANDRVTQVNTALYSFSSTFTVVNSPTMLIGYVKEDFTVYNSAGEQSETYTDYVNASNTLEATTNDTLYYYDAKGNVVRTAYADGTEQRTVYDSMNRVVWQTDRYSPSDGNPNGTNTIYDAMGRASGTVRYRGVEIAVATDPANSNFYDSSETTYGSAFSSSSTSYDGEGRTSAQVGADGRTTATTYLSDGGTQTTAAVSVSGESSVTQSESDRYQIMTFTPGGTIATGDQFKITLTAASGGTPQTLTVTATGSSLYTLDNLIVTDWNASGNSLFTGSTYGMTATYDPDSQSVHLISKSYDVAWSTVAVSEVSGSATFSDEVIHNDWSEDGDGNQTVTEYDAMGRVYRTDYPDGMVSGTPTYGIGSYTENLYGANGNAVPSYSVSGQTITAGYEEVDFDQLGNTTESFYDITGKLTDQYEPAVSDPYAAVVLGDGPVAYYRLDESSGTTAHDSSGNGNVGSYSGTYTLGVTGPLTNDSDTAASFNGSSGQVTIANAAALDTNQFTVEAWINASGSSTNQEAVSSNALIDSYTYAEGWTIIQGSNGHWQFWVDSGYWGATVLDTGISVSATEGSWEHIVGTFDGTTAKVYVNGTLEATAAVSYTYEPNTANNLAIGSGYGGGGSYFNGKVDEVSLYNYALSANQVANHYSAGKGTIAGNSQLTMPHWNYGYDLYGDEISQTDPKGQTTTWDYDALGNKTIETLPNGQSQSWVYDYNFERLSETIDFDGNKALYNYEPFGGTSAGLIYHTDTVTSAGTTYNSIYNFYGNANRLLMIEDAPSVGTTAYTTYGYDASWNIDSISTTIPSQTINYVYDAATNRLIETWTGTTHSTAITDTLYGYDAQGRLASATIVAQDGAAPALTTSPINYFDADGNSVTPTSNYPTTLYTYDADGNITKVTYPNGTETDTDYSGFWTATGVGGVFGTETITNKRGTLTLSSFAYSFDADRRKISDLEMMTDSGEGATSTALYTWTYDALSRLTSEKYDYGNDDSLGGSTHLTTDDYTDNYTYDLDGNRILKTVDTSNDGTINQTIYDSFNANNELLAETDNATYFTKYNYDANGSPTTVTTVSAGTTTTTNNYTYDPQNRMITAVINGVTTVYLYSDDGNNDIVSETTGSSAATTYVWDTMNPNGYAHVLETWNGGSEPAETFTIALNVIGQNISGAPSYASTYFMFDGQGSTRQLTAYTPLTSSTNGHVVGRDDYDAFGNPIKFTASTHAASYVTAPIGFKGTFLDSATGNYIEGRREYDPELDRFWTEDSGNFAPGNWDNANLYVSFGGSPLDLSDPSGQDSLGELLVDMGIDSVLNSISLQAVGPALKSVASNVASAILPTDVMDQLSKLNWRHLSAIMVGANVGYTVSRGIVGVGGGGGTEVLWSPHTHNWGVYGFVDANVSILGGTGFGSSVKVGAIFNTPTLGDYSGPFRYVSMGWNVVPPPLKSVFSQEVVNSHMLTIPPGTPSLPGGVSSGVGGALLQTGRNLLADVFTRLDNKVLSIFWSPYVAGAFGFSVESQFSEDGSSGLSTGLQKYWLVPGFNDSTRLL